MEIKSSQTATNVSTAGLKKYALYLCVILGVFVVSGLLYFYFVHQSTVQDSSDAAVLPSEMTIDSTIKNSPVLIPNESPIAVTEAPTPSFSMDTDIRVIYYTQRYQDDKKIYDFYRASINPLVADKSIFTLDVPQESLVKVNQDPYPVIYYTRRFGTTLVVHEVSIPDFSDKEIFKIELPTGRRIGDVRRISNESFAYIDYKEALSNAEDSFVSIFSIKDNKMVETYSLGDSGKYSGYGFKTSYDSGEKIVLHETGGDAGYVWSVWYLVDRTTQKVTKLEGLPKYGTVNVWSYHDGGDSNTIPVQSAFSPDGSQFAYVDYSVSIPESAYVPETPSWSTCKHLTNRSLYSSEGGVVRVYDLRTNSEKEIFRENTLHSNNLCMAAARRLFGVSWTTEGIYTANIDKVLNVNDGINVSLYSFDEPLMYSDFGYSPVAPGSIIRPQIVTVKGPYVYFADYTVGIIGNNRAIKYVSNTMQPAGLITY